MVGFANVDKRKEHKPCRVCYNIKYIIECFKK